MAQRELVRGQEKSMGAGATRESAPDGVRLSVMSISLAYRHLIPRPRRRFIMPGGLDDAGRWDMAARTTPSFEDVDFGTETERSLTS